MNYFRQLPSGDELWYSTTMQKILNWLYGELAVQWGMSLLRIAIGIVFIWFGALKLVGASPVFDLVATAYDFLPMSMEAFVMALGVLEVLIGLGLIFKIALRFTILLLFLQMGRHLLRRSVCADFILRFKSLFPDDGGRIYRQKSCSRGGGTGAGWA